MKTIGPAIKVGITALVALALAYWAFMMLAKGGCAGKADEFAVHAFYRDATGLVEKSQVQIAGLNVGHIVAKKLSVKPPRPELIKAKRFARITIALDPSVVLFEDAVLFKKQRSLLGGFYLEIDPGTPGRKRIKSGEELVNVREAVTTSDVIREINSMIPHLREVAKDIKTFTGGPLQNIGKNIDEGIRENRDNVKKMLANMEAITADIRRMTGGAGKDVDQILDDIKATTGVIRKVVGRSDKDVEDTAKKVKQGLDKLALAIDKLDTVMGNVKGITGDMQQGKGTVGRLLKDEALIDDVEGVVRDAGSFVKSMTDLQTIVGLRSEYNFQANSIKTYLRVEIQPRPDKYYLIELIQDPRGSRNVSTKITRSDDPSKPQLTREEVVEITNAFRFTFQFAKRLSFATFRFGIKENTGGIGIDMHLWDDRIRIESDLFDFSANVWPRYKLLASWEFFRRLYVVGGVDDMFNDRPVDGSTGGRDYFIGAQIRFNDEDLKSLLLFGGSAIGGVSGGK